MSVTHNIETRPGKGVVLSGFGLRHASRSNPPPASPAVATRPELQLSLGALLFVLVSSFVAVMVLAIVPVSVLHPDMRTDEAPAQSLVAIAIYAALAFGCYRLARRTGDVRACLGLVRPSSWPRALKLVALVLVADGFVLAAQEPLIHGMARTPMHPTHFHSAPAKAVGLALAAIVAIVVAPLVEELFFRGAGYAALRFRLGPLASALLTGTFFGALHFRPWLIIPLAFIGILLGWLYERTNSILPGMIAHATHNSACAVIFLLYFS